MGCVGQFGASEAGCIGVGVVGGMMGASEELVDRLTAAAKAELLEELLDQFPRYSLLGFKAVLESRRDLYRGKS